jgi:hypothetical protein
MSDAEDDILVSIIRAPLPTHRGPISERELEALAAERSDVALYRRQSGTRGKNETILVRLPQDSATASLTHFNGRLIIENPDQETLGWMLGLAADLDARVRRSGYRTYRTPTETYVHPEDEGALKLHERRVAIAGNPWIPFTATIMKYVIILFFITLAVVGYFVGSLFEK